MPTKKLEAFLPANHAEYVIWRDEDGEFALGQQASVCSAMKEARN